MKKGFWLKGTALAVAACLLLMAGAQQEQSTKTKQAYVDTPRNKTKDIDEALQQLEKARGELEKALQNRDWEKDISSSLKELDADKMKLQIEQALSQADAAKIQAELQKAMKQIDMEKMKADLQKAIAEVDAGKMKTEIAQAMKEVDFSKLKADIESSLAAVDMEKITAEMHHFQDVDMQRLQEQLKHIQPEIEKSMSAARESMEKTKKELTAYKGFINDLQRDGLVSKDKYTIEYKNGGLIINGKKQPDSIKKKYSSFLKDRKNFTIRKNDDDFNIDHD